MQNWLKEKSEGGAGGGGCNTHPPERVKTTLIPEYNKKWADYAIECLSL